MNKFEAALEAATAAGHDLEHDPSHALSSMGRYTCRHCGRAVVGTSSHAYGSATEEACTAKPAAVTPGAPRLPVNGWMAVVTVGGVATARAATVLSRHRSWDAASRRSSREKARGVDACAEWAEEFVAAGGSIR